MGISQTGDTGKSSRRRFQGTALEERSEVPLPDLSLEREVLAEVLPNATLEALATQTQAQDQRKRKLTCVVFFWLMILVVGPGGPISLSGVVSFLVVAYAMAGMGVVHVHSFAECPCLPPIGYCRARTRICQNRRNSDRTKTQETARPSPGMLCPLNTIPSVPKTR